MKFLGVKTCAKLEAYIEGATAAHTSGDRDTSEMLLDAALGHMMKHESKEAAPKSWEQVVSDVFGLFKACLTGERNGRAAWLRRERVN